MLDVVGAQGLQSYLKGALGAARAEAAAAPPPSGDAHRVRVLRAEGFASDVKALSKRVQDEGVRSEFARFFVTKQQADELGRPSLETSHMPCDPGAHRAGHRCMKDCLLRLMVFQKDCLMWLMVFQEDWLAHAAPVAERLAAARGAPRRDVAAAEGWHVGRAGPARGACSRGCFDRGATRHSTEPRPEARGRARVRSRTSSSAAYYIYSYTTTCTLMSAPC